MRTQTSKMLILGVAMLLGWSRFAHAATSYTWSNTLASGTYDFNTAGNWTPAGGPPGSAAADLAAFNTGADGKVFVITNASSPANPLRSVNVAKSSGSVTWNISGGFDIQDTATGDYNTFDLNTIVNINSGGALTLGSVSNLNGTARIIRGGVLNVKSGGTLNVSASGSTGFYVGNTSGSNILNVESGGALNFNSGLFRIGYNGGAGTLNSSGTVSSVSGLRVGEGTAGSAGTVNVRDGTFTVSAGSTFGISANTTGTLNVVNGTYTQDNNSSLNIGSSGVGILNVSGGTLNVNTGSSAGQGRLTLNAASIFDLSGGNISVRELVDQVSAQARHTFSGGTLSVNSSFNSSGANGAGVQFRVGDGSGATATLNLNNVTTVMSVPSAGPALYIATDGVLNGSGTASTRGNVQIAGTLNPGGTGAAGTFDIAGAYQFDPGSILNFELGGTTTSQYDRWLGTGDWNRFGGTLNLSLIGGFNPAEGDTFDLFDFGSIDPSSTTFEAVNLPALGAGLAWDQSQLYTAGILSVIPEPATFGLMSSGLLFLLVAWRRK